MSNNIDETKKDISLKTDSSSKPRRPGRPCLIQKKEIIERKGIVDTPTFNTNIMELVYDGPQVFKKIFNLFKLMDVKEIKISFMLDHVDIITTDHLQKNVNKLTINCSKLIHYYCSYPITITLNAKNIEKVIQKLDKTYHTITIISKEISYRNEILIIFRNSEIDMDEYHTINLIETEQSELITCDKPNYDLYPIQFQLTSKLFKKIITDMASFSNTFTIEKIKGIALQFSCMTPEKTIKVKHIYKNEGKIKLKSTILEDDIFSVSTKIDYIKALSNSLIGDTINFYVDKEEDIVFKLIIDNGTFDLTIYTKIIKYYN